MTPMRIIALVATALVFAMWALTLFRTLFALRRKASARTGKAFPGPLDSLREWGLWLRDPSLSAERRRLFVMTICVILLALLNFLSAGAPPIE